jgi:hypothetical protein
VQVRSAPNAVFSSLVTWVHGVFFKMSFTFNINSLLFLCQRLNTATSSPPDDVHHYVIPPKLLDSIFNKLPVRQWEKEKAVLYPVEVSPPIADSFYVAIMARKHSVVNLREINRNNTHAALGSVLTCYG